MDGVEKKRTESMGSIGPVASPPVNPGNDIAAEQWGGVLTTSDLAIIASDIKGTIELVSPGAAKLFGYAQSELIGQNISTLCPPALRNDQRSKQKKIQTSGGVSVFETERIKADGSVVSAELSHTLRYDTAGQATGVIVSIRDISERKHKEEKLRLSEERLDWAMSVSNDGLVDWDLTTNTFYFDARYYTMAGYEPDEFPANFEQFAMRINPDDYKSTAQAIDDYLSGRKDTFEEEFRFLRKDDTWMWIRARINIVERDSEGTATRLIGTHTDITEQQQAKAENLILEEKLQRSQKMEAIGLLAGGIAHDFNNMLSAILCTTELAQQTNSPESPVQEALGEILDASKRAADLTQQLLAFSRRQLTQPKVIHVGNCLSQLIPMLQRTIGENIVLSANTSRQTGLVRVDPSQIEQAIINLVLNAKDAMPQGGTLDITSEDRKFNETEARRYGLSMPGNFVTITVCDSGTGIEDVIKAKIFDPFFTTKEVGKGTGLGLSSVLGSVEQNGGHLHLDSEIGRGSCFTIMFPRVKAKKLSVPARDAAKSKGGNETILVVEDEKMLRKIAVKILKKWGYNVISAASGPEALELVSGYKDKIHLLLSDVVMPYMSGPELATELLKVRPNTKVLFVSGYNDDSIVEQGFVDEKVNLLPKPYSVESLAQSVREIIDAPQN